MTPVRRLVGAAFAVTLTLAAAVFAFSRSSQVTELGDLIGEADAVWIAAALACQCAAFALGAYVWWRTRRVLKSPIGFTPLFGLSVAKLFSDQAVPSAGLSGAAFLLHALTRRRVAFPTAMTAFTFGAGTFIVAFCIASIVSAAILLRMDATPALAARTIRALLFLVGGVAGAAAVVAASPRLRSLVRRRTPNRMKRLRQMIEPSIRALRDRWRLFLRLTGVQLAGRMADAATLACACLALGAPVGLGDCFVAVSVASLAATVAPLPMGVGPFEGAAVAVLTLSGLHLESALATVLLYRGASLWLPLLPGFLIAQREVLSGRKAQRRRA